VVSGLTLRQHSLFGVQVKVGEGEEERRTRVEDGRTDNVRHAASDRCQAMIVWPSIQQRTPSGGVTIVKEAPFSLVLQ